MICLGIESTAHTFGISIVELKLSHNKVLSNIINAYKTESGGLIPAKLAEHHVEVLDETLKKALEKAGIKPESIDLIAFSQGPGIGHALRIGAGVARSLALLLNKPLIGVNHCIAHLEIGRFLTKAKDPVLLYVSGANTQVIAYEAGKYRVFGETLDLGAGNFLDSFARELGLGFPGGPRIEEYAKQGKKYIKLPYSVKGMDISLGGMETNLRSKISSKHYSKEDLCYSVQETVFAMLVEVAERAMAHTGKNELLLGGGVACNKRLQEMCRIMCEERGAKSFVLDNQFLIDNAAMIAITGIEMHKAGMKAKVEESDIRPYERTDDVSVKWR
ncbi:MAG TPA: bifunctional N(6)-L-threonylcarbamoyladenine synthase/serine/threonine protein kinase [Candidatus Nanoarchaeia archaeon]|nr:bifunctional N(6)-L-threonylcarbamoyladenine synthase/serine/threonine protein kinase [Candidatus Nanoarchaeia archaeon]